MAALLMGVIMTANIAGCGTVNEPATGESEVDETVKETVEETIDTEETAGEKEVDVEEEEPMLVEDVYSNAGLVLLLETCKKYYNKETGSLKTSLLDDREACAWPFASFLESLSEAYKRYPDNEEVKENYESALNVGLKGYLVEDATINSPAGTFEHQTYYNAGWKTSGDYYYDDNAWICYQMFQAYDLLGDEKYLEQAEKLLEFFWTGYDEVQGGAVYWDKEYGKHGKGVCTNAPITICYLLGYQKTGNEEYLERGKKLYNWMVNSALMTDQYTIHAGFTEKDEVDNWIAAYDQGTLIYATSLLYEITGETEYLINAGKMAQGTAKLLFTNKDGKVVMRGNPIFKSWCVGWTVRGMVKYYETCKINTHTFMDQFLEILDVNLTTKNAAGQYDPFFSTGEWWDMPGYDTDVIQPTGMSTIYTISGYFHENYSK